MPDFVHLHCHTEYSLLDGAIRIKDLCKRAVEYKMPAAAITDHGNLFGAVIFYQACRDAGIKPLVGCEVYVAPGARQDKEARGAGKAGYHLVLLAQNNEGYHNLLKLVSEANLTGFHYKPRVDKELLRQHSSGLIALSACLAGEVIQTTNRDGYEAGLGMARQYMEIFPDRFYMEIQANDLPDQRRANPVLIEMARELKLPLIATNDCHYLDRSDEEAHEILLCVQTNANITDAKRMSMGGARLHFASPDEMAEYFKDVPDAISNSMEIVERCNVEIELGKHHFPVYDLPQGMSLEAEFCRLVDEGLKERLANLPYKVDEAEYWKRLEIEKDVICPKGFAGYFLIVQDFINWSKRNGIPVGPGRGSAAGSLAAYCLRITNLDPIRYTLLFERFLNVERISMPDIDVDFCERRRHEAIRYVTEKYGVDNVAQITTFGTMKAKAVVRDVGRALGMSFADTDRIAKLIPEDLKMTIAKALEQEPELSALAKSDSQIGKLIDVSRRLEGLARHASTHAAGVVISDKPMSSYLPIYKGKKGEVVTQYDMKRVEKVGLIKFDFLGLKTLTVIQDCLELIRQNGKEPPDLDVLLLEDEESFKMLARGQTDGVFQLESSGMRRVLVDLKPSCFEDLIALLALYRPGPLESGMVADFIERKHGRQKIDYPLPQLEPILKDTYGVILYQEQVMKIAQVLADYSLGEGDLLRRAMGKKDPVEMGKQRERFMDGARKNKHPEAKAKYIFDLMEKFAGYGFNKSHSAAYALITFHTAYLKRHFPAEFMAALITSEMDTTDKILKYIAACRDMGIQTLPPDVNIGLRSFGAKDGNIVYGLAGIKNVGDEALKDIIAERDESGPYQNLLDLCCRVNMRKVTKRVLESLIKAGAFDSFGTPRRALMAGLERVASIAQKRAKDKSSGQMSMLGMICAPGGDDGGACLGGLGVDCEEQRLEEWPDDEKMRLEKEAIGFYLSSHPLLTFRDEIGRMRLQTLEECAEMKPGSAVRVGVLVTAVKEHITKKGDRMAFCQVEDLTGSGELTMFPEIYLKAKAFMSNDLPLLVEAKLDAPSDAKKKGANGNGGGGGGDDGEEGPKQVKMLAQDIKLLSAAQAANESSYAVCVAVEKLQNGGAARLKEIIGKYKGNAPLQLCFTLKGAQCRVELGERWRVRVNPDLKRELEEWSRG